MANIHQTLKRVEALYAELLGTREEITRCVEELQRWQEESRAWRARVREERQAAVEDVERLGRAAKKEREEIELLARATRERWGLAYLFFTIFVTLSSLLLVRAWYWMFPWW